jgi:carbamate kinase
MSRSGWTFAREHGGYRRVVASPAPRRIRELDAVRLLLKGGVLVICAGGGGIPVTVTAEGGVRGVEAVIDKDLTAALLAEQLGADILLLLTDVSAVWTQWPMAAESRPIARTTPAELRARQFAAGSMGPKVEAACRFVERTGRLAAIGAMEDAPAILDGKSGTIVTA